MVFLSLAFTPWTGQAQEPVRNDSIYLSGSVIDAVTGAGIAGALLTIRPQGSQVLADSLGAFRFHPASLGILNLSVQRLGYIARVVSVNVTGDGAQITVELTPDPLRLEGVSSEIVTMRGTVVDARTNLPLPFVSLRLLQGAVREVGQDASDTTGYFEFGPVAAGYYVLRPRLAGYHSYLVPLAAFASSDSLELRLERDSLVSAGLPILNDEFHRRRNFFSGIAVAYGGRELNEYGRRNAFDFIAADTWVTPVPCESGPGVCVLGRGNRVVEPTVIIDEVEICGPHALDVFSTYRPDDFYVIEVFGTSIIRGYTHDFVDRVAVRVLGGPYLPPARTC